MPVKYKGKINLFVGHLMHRRIFQMLKYLNIFCNSIKMLMLSLLLKVN